MTSCITAFVKFSQAACKTGYIIWFFKSQASTVAAAVENVLPTETKFLEKNGGIFMQKSLATI